MKGEKITLALSRRSNWLHVFSLLLMTDKSEFHQAIIWCLEMNKEL